MDLLNASAISDNVKRGFILTEDNQKISYTLFSSGHSKVIIIAHGFYNSQEAQVLQQLAKNLLEEYDIFMFDFRGHGKSSGLFTWASKEGQDLMGAARYLKGKYRKTGLIAFSLGASIAINVLSREQIADSFVCVSAPAYISKIDYNFWRLDWQGDVVYTLLSKEGRIGKGVRLGPFWLKKEEPINNIAKLKIPVLFLHGEKDWVIRPWHSEALFKRATGIKKIVYFKNGSHAEYLIRDNQEQFMEEIKKWFEQALK